MYVNLTIPLTHRYVNTLPPYHIGLPKNRPIPLHMGLKTGGVPSEHGGPCHPPNGVTSFTNGDSFFNRFFDPKRVILGIKFSINGYDI